MDILDDMGVSKLSAKVFLKVKKKYVYTKHAVILLAYITNKMGQDAINIKIKHRTLSLAVSIQGCTFKTSANKTNTLWDTDKYQI